MAGTRPSPLAVPLREVCAARKSARQPSVNSSPVARTSRPASKTCRHARQHTQKKTEPTAPLWMASQVRGERFKKKSPPPSAGLSHCGPGMRPSAENTASASSTRHSSALLSTDGTTGQECDLWFCPPLTERAPGAMRCGAAGLEHMIVCMAKGDWSNAMKKKEKKRKKAFWVSVLM